MKQGGQRPSSPGDEEGEDGEAEIVLVLGIVRPQFRLLHILGVGFVFRARSWWRMWMAMSRSRMNLVQRWHSVVREPSVISWGVRFERRTSADEKSGSSGDCCATSKWQNWQRIGLAGQIVVRCCASERREGKGWLQPGQESGVWDICMCLL